VALLAMETTSLEQRFDWTDGRIIAGWQR